MATKTITKLDMHFKCAGMVSTEEWDVLSITDKRVVLYDEYNPETQWKFDRKTGKCLNDNNDFGASRSITPF